MASGIKKWVTDFKAICALTGELKTYVGPNVEAPNQELAQEWCYKNAGHLKVLGELVSLIPCKENSFEADFSKMIDYQTIQSN